VEHLGGALFNKDTTTLNDVVIRDDRGHVGSGPFTARRATLTWQASPAWGRG
jgi:hypothetical protein